MSKKNGDWEVVEVKNFIWKRLCKSETGRFDFAPLLLDHKRETPSSPKFAEIVGQMKEQGYLTDNRPNYGHYWLKLKASGKSKCEDEVESPR